MNGFIEDYPLTTPVPTKINFIQKSTPELKIKIEGTIKHDYDSYFWSSGGQIDFTIFYRESPDVSYKDSLIMEFSVPFERDEFYQNRKILYSTEAEDRRYQIRENSIHIFELDPDFHVLKGEEISENINFRTFETKIMVDSHLVSTSSYKNSRGKKRYNYKTVYETHVVLFDLYFEKAGKLHRMKISGSIIETGTVSKGFLITILVINFIVTGIILQNLLAQIISDRVFERDESFQFLASFITSCLSPFYLLIFFKHVNSFLWFLYVFGAMGFLYCQNACTYEHLLNLVKKGKCTQRTRGVALLAFGLNICWIIALVFQPWMLLRSFFFYAAVLVIVDLAVLMLTTFMKKEEIVSNVLMAGLRGFLTEILVLNLYVFLFFDAHAELPSIWKRFVLVDLGILVLVMLLAAVVAFVRGVKSRGSGYSEQELREFEEFQQYR